MDGLIKLCRTSRVNDYFRTYAHNQIDIGFRILEYLEPDSVFKPQNLSQSTIDLFLRNDIPSAVSNIFYELGIDESDDYGLKREAIGFANEVYKDYIQKKRKEALSRKEELLIQIGEIENELRDLDKQD